MVVVLSGHLVAHGPARKHTAYCVCRQNALQRLMFDSSDSFTKLNTQLHELMAVRAAS
jgi:hypothetical protein